MRKDGRTLTCCWGLSYLVTLWLSLCSTHPDLFPSCPALCGGCWRVGVALSPQFFSGWGPAVGSVSSPPLRTSLRTPAPVGPPPFLRCLGLGFSQTHTFAFPPLGGRGSCFCSHCAQGASCFLPSSLPGLSTSSQHGRPLHASNWCGFHVPTGSRPACPPGGRVDLPPASCCSHTNVHPSDRIGV